MWATEISDYVSALCGLSRVRREGIQMEVVKIILIVLEVLTSIVLIAAVLMQSGKEAGLSGAISGNADTYLDKTGNSWDKKLARWTKWIALVWAVLGLALNLV